MTGATAAHLLGALLLTLGLPAHLHGRLVLSKFLALFGVAIAHVPDLVAALVAR